MELPNIDLQNLNRWFSNVVDTVNFDLSQIQIVVPDLNMLLTNLDTPPVEDFNDSLTKLVKSINDGFSQIQKRLDVIEKGSV